MYSLVNGSILDGKSFRDGYISVSGEVITDELYDDTLDLKGGYVMPGFIEIHTHGGDGIDVNDADARDLDRLSVFFASHGVSAFLASVLTDSVERTEKALKNIKAAMDNGTSGAKLLGAHLEGPFLSPKFKGAMPKELLIDGSIDLVRRYNESCGGIIKYITIAPEERVNMDMIPELRKMGIAVALGHSDATYEQCVRAHELGARSITHLFNAMRPFHHHEVGIAGAALLEDFYTECICDGLHLSPQTVRIINKMKGVEKMLSITDCIMAAGLPDGNYKLGINDVTVSNGDAKLSSSGVRAGSTLTFDRAFKNLVNFTGMSPAEAALTFSKNQAELLELKGRGSLRSGSIADITVMDRDFNVILCVSEGRIIYRRLP